MRFLDLKKNVPVALIPDWKLLYVSIQDESARNADLRFLGPNTPPKPHPPLFFETILISL